MEHTYGTFTWSQNIYETTGQRENTRFIPLYDVTDEAYNVYFRLNKKVIHIMENAIQRWWKNYYQMAFPTETEAADGVSAGK